MKLSIPSSSIFFLGSSLALAFQPSIFLTNHYVGTRTRMRTGFGLRMPGDCRSISSTSTRLNDVSEWRDLMFEPPATLSDLDMEDHQEGPLREICILPFPLEDTLIQGETKELCLYEERFHKLFTKSTNEHGGVVAMGLLAPPAGILQTMPLCEIESFRTMEGDTGFGTSFSILATIRSVARASLVYIEDENEEDEFLTGWCTELGDNTSSERLSTDETNKIPEVANRMADRCEEVFNSILELEQKIESLGDDVQGEFIESEATLRRKLLEAELEIDGDEEDDDEEDDDEDESDEYDERKMLERAFQLAKSTDTQGYRISSSTPESTSSSSEAMMRSIQDLTALSWAYFSTDPEPQDLLSYRLRALEIVDLSDRLKLALVMMMDRRSKLRAALRESEDTRRGWDDDEDDNISL